MSNRFKPNEFEVKSEEKDLNGPRVFKLETKAKQEISSYQIPSIKELGQGDYKATKAKFGALAATDSERGTKNVKDRRFNLSPLLRDPLAIEQEEQRAIESLVQTRVQVLAEEAKRQAAAQGYQEGLRKGHQEATERTRQEGASRIAAIEELFGQFEGAKAEIYQANERFLIELIYRIARMVTLKELSADKDYLSRLVRELIERSGVRENIRIRVNPEDMSALVKIKDDLEKTLGALKNVNVESSNQVKRGGCAIETEWNAIDASIESQLEGIHKALIGSEGGSQA